MLFDRVTLRSREDLLQLIAFLETPTSRLKRYIQCLDIEQDGPSEPWLHTISSLFQLLPVFLLQPRISLDFAGPSHKTQRSIRSIHSLAPRSLPRNFSGRIIRLSLHDICFRTFWDLVSLVGELPDLENLSCRNLTWKPLSSTLPPRYPRRITSYPLELKMMGCTDDWAATIFFVMSYSSAVPKIHCSQAESVRKLASSISSWTNSEIQTDGKTSGTSSAGRIASMTHNPYFSELSDALFCFAI